MGDCGISKVSFGAEAGSVAMGLYTYDIYAICIVCPMLDLRMYAAHDVMCACSARVHE